MKHRFKLIDENKRLRAKLANTATVEVLRAELKRVRSQRDQALDCAKTFLKNGCAYSNTTQWQEAAILIAELIKQAKEEME